jgi:hypothetical protein
MDSIRTGYTWGIDAQICNMNSNLVSRMVAGCIDVYFVRERKERK